MIKKILPLILLSVFILSGATHGLTNDLPEPGMLPDHPLYFLKSWAENIGTFFTFGEIAKAERYLFLAERRISETKALVEKDESEFAQRTLEQHREQLNRALEKATKAKQKGINADNILAKISEATLRHQSVLIEVYERVPEEARPAIERAMEQSMKGHEEALQAISKEKKEEIGEEIETKRQETFEKAEKARQSTPGIPAELPGIACPMVYQPVCGVDGKTYSNRCVAEMMHGVKVAHEGKCGFPETPGPPVEIPIELEIQEGLEIQ